MLPYFYQEHLNILEGNFVLDEAASHHCAQVLRMQAGTALLLTNGKGLLANANIIEPSRKRTLVQIHSATTIAASMPKFALAIAFTKNNSRNEWLLEKATEMGISDIFPIMAHRSEKEKWKPERLHNILVSAMLQSQQVHLPILHEPQKPQFVLDVSSVQYEQQFIAHCEQGMERNSYWSKLKTGKNTLVWIGPEGDFTTDEIEMCIAAGCIPVSFGTNRLRTETAGLYACAVYNAKNNG